MSNGHRYRDVIGYTLGQIVAFREAIAKREMQELKRLSIAARMAWAESSDFSQFMDELDAE